MGFYKTYVVEAQDAQEAENLAVSKIAADPKWDGLILNDHDDRPVMYLDALAEVHKVPILEQGYIFYPEDETDGD
jgi:hypothetical protein